MDMQQIFNQKKEVLTLFILPQQAGDISSISLRKIQFTFSTESILSLINPNNARLKQLEGVKRESSLLIVIMGFFSKFKTKKEQPSSSDKAPAGTTSADDDDEKKKSRKTRLGATGETSRRVTGRDRLRAKHVATNFPNVRSE